MYDSNYVCFITYTRVFYIIYRNNNHSDYYYYILLQYFRQNNSKGSFFELTYEGSDMLIQPADPTVVVDFGS